MSLRAEAQARDRVRVEDGKPLQRLQVNLCSVEAGCFVCPVPTGDELGARAQPHIGFENAIRVVQIRQDQVELGEIVRQVLGQLAATCEEASE